ncbi:hypothetical protein [Endozoicomonas sp. ONNA2]|uniref:hypothetical protein n=1 Tax=Endozoicomonas sp. ONNA2 TaxID=2828741 RepID=UPI002147E3B6|nr:hypothetical protein [Endozoicomonas sp. ONNA2]
MVKQNIFHGKEHKGKEKLFLVLFVCLVVPSQGALKPTYGKAFTLKSVPLPLITSALERYQFIRTLSAPLAEDD